MTKHHHEDDPSVRHREPAPVAQAGEIDGGVTPHQGAGDHPAQGLEHHHDLVWRCPAGRCTRGDERGRPRTGTSSSGVEWTTVLASPAPLHMGIKSR
jgi:hypothetical protein